MIAPTDETLAPEGVELARVTSFSAMGGVVGQQWTSILIYDDGDVVVTGGLRVRAHFHATVTPAGIDDLRTCIDRSGFGQLDDRYQSTGDAGNGKFCAIADAAETTVHVRMPATSSMKSVTGYAMDRATRESMSCTSVFPPPLLGVYNALTAIEDDVVALAEPYVAPTLRVSINDADPPTADGSTVPGVRAEIDLPADLAVPTVPAQIELRCAEAAAWLNVLPTEHRTDEHVFRVVQTSDGQLLSVSWRPLLPGDS